VARRENAAFITYCFQELMYSSLIFVCSWFLLVESCLVLMKLNSFSTPEGFKKQPKLKSPGCKGRQVDLLDLLKPEMHSSRNSSVRCGSLAASVLLMETMNSVLLAGMQRPDVSSSWPSIFRLKVQVNAHSRLYAADLKEGRTTREMGQNSQTTTDR